MSYQLLMEKSDYPGFLITFCGIDGCGKSTMINMLQKQLIELGHSVILTKQPTDLVRKSKIFRTFMDSPDTSKYDYRSLSLFAASDRIQHSNKFIKPELFDGKIVISDRYFFSCLANLNARGYKNDKWIYEIAEFIPKPDLAFFLDVPLELAIDRVRQRVTEKDRWININLHKNLREEYINICHANSGILINSSGTSESSFEQVWNEVYKKMKEKRCNING